MRAVVKTIRFMLKVLLLPVQALLTLLFMAVHYLSGILIFVCSVVGLICILGGVVDLLSAAPSGIALQVIIGGVIIAAVPRAISYWGENGIAMVKVVIKMI